MSYLLDNRSAEAGERFAALSATFDHWTRAHLDSLGLATAWACWEVGAGGPAVPTWLAERVGPDGQVVATDIDTSWIPANAPFAIEQRDVATDQPPPGPFDLVHARLVLTHIAQRDEALRRMATPLRPGGWLVVEDFDVAFQPVACPNASTPDEHRANRIREGFLQLLAARGVDLTLGRTLPRRLVELGLTNIGADAYTPLVVPGALRLEIANTLQVRADLETIGHGDDIDAHLHALASGNIDVATPPLVTAWGRQP